MPEQAVSNETRPAEKPFPWRCPKCRQPTVNRVTMPYCCQRTHNGCVVTVEVPNLAVPRCSNCGEVVFDYAADEQIRAAFRGQFDPVGTDISKGQKPRFERPARAKNKLGRARRDAGCVMQRFRNPTPADQFEYLLRLYFGSDSDRLSCCIGRAYRDLNRTLHGFAKVPKGVGIRARASAVVRAFLTHLGGTSLDQAEFDRRHQAACTELCSIYSAAGFAAFRVGQAQKWLNMALKYVFAFGQDRLPGYADVFGLAHIPLDNIILDELRGYGVPRLTTPWSRLDKYEEYMGIQHWVRSAFPGSTPLAVEFWLFLNAGVIPSDEDTAEPSTAAGPGRT